jgi:hypothetical protein
MTDILYQITSKNFVAGLITRKGMVIKTAPIISGMRSLSIGQVLRRCSARGWELKGVKPNEV